MTKTSNKFNGVRDSVISQHGKAKSGVEGEPGKAMEGAPAEAKSKATSMYRRAIVSGGAVSEYGQAVSTFNSKVSGWNSEIDAASDKKEAKKIYDKHLSSFNTAETVLTDAGKDAKHALVHWNEDKTLKKLWKAGALPTTAKSVFKGLDLKTADLKDLPPDLRNKTPKELEKYLSEHPELRSVTRHLLDQKHLSDQELAVVKAQAKVDSALLKDAVENGDPSKSTLEQIGEAQSLLNHINKNLGDGGKLNEASHAFMFTWMNGAGAAALAKLPSVVRDSVRTTGGGRPGYSAGPQYKQYLRPVANSIMNLSNPDKYGSGVLGHINRGDRPMDAPKVTLGEMPKAIQDLVNMRIGESDGSRRWGEVDDDGNVTFDSVKNLDRFNGWVDLMETSTVNGGDDFTAYLGEQALLAKQDLNAIVANAGTTTNATSFEEGHELDSVEDFRDLRSQLNDSSVSDLLSVVGRSSDGSAEFVTSNEDNLKRVLGMNWDDDQGAIDVIGGATDRDASDGQGGTAAQAEATLDIMKEVGSDRDGYLGQVDVKIDEHGNVTQERMSDGRMTEGISDAVVDMGIRWVDQLGRDADHDELDGEDIILGDETEDKFLQFVSASGDKDATRFHVAASADAQQQIAEAMKENPDDVTSLVKRAGRLEGQINEADYQYGMDIAKSADDKAYEKAYAAYQAEHRREEAGKFVANLLVSAVPDPTGMLSTAAGGVIDQIGNAEPPDKITEMQDQTQYDTPADFKDDAVQKGEHLMIAAAVTSGKLDIEDVPPDLVTVDDATGSTRLRDFSELNDKTPLENYFDGSEGTSFRDAVPNGVDIDGAENDYSDSWESKTHWEPDQYDTSGDWRDPDNVQRFLYGDNPEDDYDPETDYSFPEWNPYPRDPDQIDDDPMLPPEDD